MYVAQHPDRLCSIARIAQAHSVSESHLMKVTPPPGDINLGWLIRSMHHE